MTGSPEGLFRPELIRLPSTSGEVVMGSPLAMSPPSDSFDLLPDDVARQLHAAVATGAVATVPLATLAQISNNFADDLTTQFGQRTGGSLSFGRRMFAGTFWDPVDRRYVRVAISRLLATRGVHDQNLRLQALAHMSAQLDVIKHIKHPHLARLVAVSHEWQGDELYACLVHEHNVDETLASTLTDASKAQRLGWVVRATGGLVFLFSGVSSESLCVPLCAVRDMMLFETPIESELELRSHAFDYTISFST